MKVLTAQWREGRVDIPEGTLLKGDSVTLLVPDREDQGLAVTSAERAMLLEVSTEQGRRGEGVDDWALLEDL